MGPSDGKTNGLRLTIANRASTPMVGHGLERVLQSTRVVPRDVVRHDPRDDDHAYSDKTQIHAQMSLIIGAEHNVVHIARESSHHNQRDVYDEECKEAEHRQEVDRSGRLPATKASCVPGKAIHHCGRHGDPSKNRQPYA